MTTKEQVLEAVEQNHIWINAFSLAEPNDETARQIGYTVIRWLEERENLLPKYNGDIGGETEAVQEALDRMATLTPVLYMSVNAS